MSFTPSPPSRQRGVIMVIAMITLAVLLIGAAVAMRSMNVTLASVGNFGFKRDMSNRSELAFRAASDLLTNGALKSAAARQSDNVALNYSARMLPTDTTGIPQVMLNIGTTPATLGGAGNAAREISIPDDQLRVHYLIERLCTLPGPFDKSTCIPAGFEPKGGSETGPQLKLQEMFRVTVRVSGPHDSYSFYQSTFTTKP